MNRGTKQQGRLVITETIGESVATVTLAGELDISTAPELESALDELAEEAAGSIILDLRQLAFTDAAGLHVIEAAAGRLGSRLVVAGPRPSVRKVIEVIHLDDRVGVRGSAEVETSDVPGSNAAYVRQLWEAFFQGGSELFARLVPDNVVWRPFGAEGQVLRGTQELLDFWGSRPSPKVSLDHLIAVNGEVLVTWRSEDLGREFWSLYRFEGRRLTEAVTFDRETDAIAALQLSRED